MRCSWGRSKEYLQRLVRPVLSNRVAPGQPLTSTNALNGRQMCSIILASRGGNLILPQDFRHTSVAANRLTRPGRRPEKVQPAFLFTMPVAWRLHLKKPNATGFFTLAASRWRMIIGYAMISTTAQYLGLRHDDLKPAFDASFDAILRFAKGQPAGSDRGATAGMHGSRINAIILPSRRSPRDRAQFP